MRAILAVWSAVVDDGGRAKAKSYADDAYATAAAEEEVKEAVRKTDVFLDDTDMEAKASKCAGLASGHARTQFQMRGGPIPHKDEFRCLGGDIIGRRTPKRQVVGAVLAQRMKDALPMARHVFGVPLSFMEKCLIEQRLVLARALFGCSYAAVGGTVLQQLRTAIMEGIWGKGRPARNVNVVCYLLAPTMVDPVAWVPHMRLRTFLRLTLGNETTSALARAAWDAAAAERATETVGPLCGPIGLLRQDLLSLGWEWPEFSRVRTERDEDLMDWDDRELEEWSHELRESLRARAWREAAQVDGLEGIDAGVDRDASLALLRTPGLDRYLAGTVRGVMANSILSRQRLLKRSMSETSECKYCGSGEEEDQRHMWWLCSRWSKLRSETAGYVQYLDTWPVCFVHCGIVTEDFHEPPGVDRTVLAGQVQRMMALIAMERCDVDKGSALVARLAMREKPEYPFGWRPDGVSYDPLAKALRMKVPQKQHDELLLLGLRTWLRELRWPPAEKQLGGRGITYLELALDFEVVTGLDLIDGPGLTRRGEQLAVLLRQTERSSHGRNTGFLGCSARATTSLAVLGGPELAGLTVRPVFAGGTDTEDCLRAAVEEAGPAGRTSLMTGLKRAGRELSAAASQAGAAPAAAPTPVLAPSSTQMEDEEECVADAEEEEDMEAVELGSQESLAADGGVPPPQQSTTVASVSTGAGCVGAPQAATSGGCPESSSSFSCSGFSSVVDPAAQAAETPVALSQASSSPVTSTTRTTPTAVLRIRRVWGDEVTPQHDAEGRRTRRLGLEREVERRRARLAANAAAEEEAKRRLSLRYPVPVAEGVLLKKGNVHTCRQHARTRCEDCALTSTPLDECCAEHHGAEDDTSQVRVDYCSEHRWTACGVCVQTGSRNATYCCKRHHVCKAHDLPTCAACQGNEESVAETQPQRCCKLGHHCSSDVKR